MSCVYLKKFVTLYWYQNLQYIFFQLVSRSTIYRYFNWYKKHTMSQFIFISRFTRLFKLVSRYFQLVSFNILKILFTFNWYLKNVLFIFNWYHKLVSWCFDVYLYYKLIYFSIGIILFWFVLPICNGSLTSSLYIDSYWVYFILK